MRKLGRLTVAALASLGLLVVVVTLTPLVDWWATVLAGPWEDPSGEILIVLAGSSLGEGVLGESSYWRCVYAARAFQEGGFRWVLVSGGGTDSVPIAGPMRRFLLTLGVPPEAILMEPASISTRDNAMFSSRILAHMEGRKVLLTSDYQMFRAARVFSKAGVQFAPRPFPDVRKRATRLHLRWPAFIDLIVETAKIAYYYSRGWL